MFLRINKTVGHPIIIKYFFICSIIKTLLVDHLDVDAIDDLNIDYKRSINSSGKETKC